MIDRAAFADEFAAKRKLPALAHEDVVTINLFLDTLAVTQLVDFPALLCPFLCSRRKVDPKHDEPDDAENHAGITHSGKRCRNRILRSGSLIGRCDPCAGKDDRREEEDAASNYLNRCE